MEDKFVTVVELSSEDLWFQKPMGTLNAWQEIVQGLAVLTQSREEAVKVAGTRNVLMRGCSQIGF